MVLLRLAEKTTGMSGDSPKNADEKEEVTSSFTVDEKTGEMPGVTKLLNRKSFIKSTASTDQTTMTQPVNPEGVTLVVPPPTASESIQPAAEVSPPEIVLSPTPTLTPSPKVPASVQKPRKRRSAQSKPLVEWTRKDLQAGQDPLAKALCMLIDRGVSQSLFLGIQAAPSNPALVFVASAAVNAGPKAAVWTGLQWDPTILPEIWNQLVTVGFVELPPPGTMTNLHSARNVSRAAFDVGNEECLVLARVGTAQMCRGILVLISRKSLVASVKQAMPLLNAAPAPARIAAAKKSA